MTTFYKIKHIETGLFYSPNKAMRHLSGCYYKTNLSVTGKVYNKKPSLKHIRSYYHPEDMGKLRRYYLEQPTRDVKDGDFKIIKYEVTEV